MKKILAMMAMFLGCGAFAGTYTWTGLAGDGLYFTAGNWNYDGVAATTSPGNAPSDDIVIDGQYEVLYVPGDDWVPSGEVTVKGGAVFRQNGGAWPNVTGTLVVDNGTVDFKNNESNPDQVRIPGTLVLRNGGELLANTLTGNPSITLGAGVSQTHNGTMTATQFEKYTLEGGTLVITAEFQPADGTVFDFEGVISCNLFAPQTANSKLTAKSGALKFVSTGYDGFYQAGSTCIDFPADSTASLTIVATTADIYSKTFGSTKYTYAGNAIGQADFARLFDVTDNEDGTVTVSMYAETETQPCLGSVAVAVHDSEEVGVVVTATIDKLGGEGTKAYLVYDTEDKGNVFASWSKSAELAVAGGQIAETVAIDLPAKTKAYFRIFLINETTTEKDVSDAIALYLRRYDVEGTVNEFLGSSETSTSLTDAAYWSLGHVPTADEIRWFENCEVTTANFAPLATDVFRGGSFTVNGELQPVNGCVFAGTDFTCTRIAPQASPAAFTATAGEFVITSDGNSFWNADANDRYCELPIGSKASFTFPMTKATFVGMYLSKFRHNGSTISATDFADTNLWIVTETEDPVSVTFTPAAPVAGGPGIKSYSAAYANSAVTVTVEPTADCAPDTVFTVYYDVTDRGHDASAWSKQAVLVDQTNGTFAVSLADATPNSICYYTIAASSEQAGATVWADGNVVVADMPTDSNVWLGKTADITSASNWSKGVVPTASDIVELNQFFTKGSELSWNVTAIPQVAGWRQTAAVTVTFNTTLEKPLTITGDVSLGTGANWTHSGPGNEGQEPEFALNVIVGGDFTIASGAYVQAGRGSGNAIYLTRGYYNAGPGFENVFTNETEYGVIAETNRLFFGRGASFGGDGGYRSEKFPDGLSFVSYGSILDPLSYGSSGIGNGVQFAGAGIVKLEVGGTLTVEGEIDAVGFGYPNLAAGLSAGASSGGSINLSAGALAGAGEINADGGADQEGGNGSGGRIRVKLTSAEATFDAFTGSIHAYGGTKRESLEVVQVAGVIDAAAGTVVKQLAADSDRTGTLLIENVTGRVNDAGATHLPAMQDTEKKLAGLRVEVATGAKVRITRDLRIKSLKVNGTKVSIGSYTASQLNTLLGTTQFTGEGVLSIGQTGMILYVR